jgi:2-amino-4-hydroxy-6-hydroxymethyldihydropteridine diphosphokinase
VPQAVLGFGSNLGARRALIRGALALLRDQPGISLLACSKLYETPALGPPQPDYLNAAARIAWVGGIEGLFAITQHVERLLGRERLVRWGARTIDIDLLHWSLGSVALPWLEVPHPELRRRTFALAPLLDVMPERAAELAPVLSELGGPPAVAEPGWLSLERSARGLVHRGSDDLAELACLGVSAVGACTRTPPRARSTLAFSLAEGPFEAGGDSPVVQLVERASRHGFAACDAVITACEAAFTRGYLIGEHRGVAGRSCLAALRLERAGPGVPTLCVSLREIS